MIAERLDAHCGYQAIQQVPGTGPVPAAIFVAEIGDLHRFAGPAHLCSWAGLTPRHRESDTVVHRGHITKQGSKLVRWAAIESPLEILEAPDLGNEDGVMPKEQSPGKPTARRYSPEEKAGAVRMVRTLRAELGTEHGTVGRVARQLGYGVESVRSWVRQADIDDGYAPGVSTAESRRIKELEQENRELKRANVNLGRFSSLAA